MASKTYGYAVEAENLKKAFGDVLAVNDVSFNVSFGECFGVLGPNGAGKTSTVRMVYGFSPLTDGKLHVFGRPIESDWRYIKYRIGVCQQENTLDPDLTVYENLLVFARYFDIPPKEAKPRANDLLDFMGLKNRENSDVAELSGGMIRRLALARSLINQPKLLILDEPTTGLDPQSRHLIWDRLEALKKQGISILLTTHYMDEASRLCDRLMIMDNAQTLVSGKPRELIEQYAGDNVLEVSPVPKDIRKYLRSNGIEYEDLGHRLLVYGQQDDALFQSIRQDRCRDGCVLRMSTLEDVFLKLTGRGLRE